MPVIQQPEVLAFQPTEIRLQLLHSMRNAATDWAHSERDLTVEERCHGAVYSALSVLSAGGYKGPDGVISPTDPFPRFVITPSPSDEHTSNRIEAKMPIYPNDTPIESEEFVGLHTDYRTLYETHRRQKGVKEHLKLSAAKLFD